MTGADDLEYRTFLAGHLGAPQFLGTIDERIDGAILLTLRAVRADTEDKRDYFRAMAVALISDWGAEQQGRQALRSTQDFEG